MLRAWVLQVNEIDRRLFQRIFGWNGKVFLDRLMIVATKSGDGQLYGVVGLLYTLWNGLAGIPFVYAAVVGFLFELPLYELAKNKIQRPRPFEELGKIKHLMAPPDKFSFPSGHTAAGFLMIYLLSTVMPQFAPFFFIWAGIIGFSRVYLGLHYPTDVLAGAILGIMTGHLGLVISDFVFRSAYF